MNGDVQARLFVALWPDPQLRHQLRTWRDTWTWPRAATPVKTERLHMTLHFLGSVSTARIAELRQGLAVPCSPFTLDLGVNQLWPHGIAVLEPHGAPAALLALHADLGAALKGLGVPVEQRPFKPHVTMARRAASAAIPEAGPSLTWAVNGYALVESTGSAYTLLQQYP